MGQYPGTRTFLAHEQVWGEEAKPNAREPLAHMFGSLNMPIQSEAVIYISESDFDSKTSQMISAFKGPSMYTQRLLCLASPLRMSKKTSGFQGSGPVAN